MKNQIKTVLLLTVLSAIFLAIGYAIGGESGMAYAFIMSLVMNFGAYWFSDKIVLAMHRAQPLSKGDEWGVYAMIEELCQKANLPIPKVYLIPQQIPNAFATGRNPKHAAVAVTQGILQILNERELRGVLAHEISHVKNHDILVSTIVATLASAIMYLAHMLRWIGFTGYAGRSNERNRGIHPVVLIITIILAPIAASLIQMAISRAREFMADESGAHVSEDPEALASALEKISNPAFIHGMRQETSDVAPAFSHLYIVNQLSGESILSLFSTHPPVMERVRRLRAMSIR